MKYYIRLDIGTSSVVVFFITIFLLKRLLTT